MRIAIDATALPRQLGGAGNYILRLVAGIRNLGTGDRIFVLTKARDVEQLGPWNELVQPVVVRIDARPVRLLWEQTLLPRELRRIQADLLHSLHYTIPLQGVRARRVVTFHDMIFFLYPEYHQLTKVMFFRRMIRLAARRADHVIADSEATRRDAIRILGMAADSITHVPLAADDRFSPDGDRDQLEAVCRKYGLRPPFILTVCTLEPRKNLAAAIGALARVRQSGIDCNLVIAGAKGWQDAPIYDEISRQGLANRVTFLGFVPAEDLPFLYRAAAVFVYPSLYEGFGLPPLEAMRCGLPVVTSNRSSMPEVVGDGGVLVDPHDVEAIAAVITEMLSNPDVRLEWGRRALRRAAAFSWEQTARVTHAVYERVLAKAR